MENNGVEIIDQPRGPWHTKTRKIAYQNQYALKVIRDEVIRPDKSEGIYDYLHVNGGSYALPIDENNLVYLVKQFRYPVNIWSIEVASGGLNKGEKHLDAAKRELEEELGIIATRWTCLSKRDDPAPHIIDSPQQIYLAEGLNQRQTNHDETEKRNIEIVTMYLDDAVQAVLNSEITETPSKLAIMLAKHHLASRR